jgi:hypothetical protein
MRCITTLGGLAMDELLQKAIERRDTLRKELGAIEAFIHALSAQSDAARKAPNQPDLFARRAPSRAERAAAVAEAMSAAERMILDEGRPLTRSELVERLEAAGHKLEGGDKSKVLGTNLWRSGRFLNIASAGYWPKASPLPQDYVSLPRRETSIK